MSILGPSPEQARHFALMLSAGAPASDAIRYFLPLEPDQEAPPQAFYANQAAKWLGLASVQAAIVALQGADWSAMSFSDRIETAIEKHYTEMAYFLYSRNYCDLNGPEKAKADTCRTALEAKLAGTAGKLTAIEQFWDDVRAGKFKIASSAPPSVALGGGPQARPTQSGEE